MPVGHIMKFVLVLGDLVILKKSNWSSHAQVYRTNRNEKSKKSEDSKFDCGKVDRKEV